MAEGDLSLCLQKSTLIGSHGMFMLGVVPF